MEFGFTQEQEVLRSAVRDFAETKLAPKVPWMEETRQVPWDIVKEMGTLGFMGVLVPQEYGGSGLGHVARTIMLEEIGRISTATAFMLQIFHLGIGPILDFGTPEQKRKYLPKLARGEWLSTVAVTEATGGSDPTSGRSTAKLEGDTYILNGRKIFITNAHIADVVTIAARTGGEGAKGISAFLVEKGFSGFRHGREERKFGLRGLNTGELVMEDCRVPAENRLGNEGDGLRVAMKAISDIGRSGMAACAVSLMTACIEAATKHAKERVLYGKPIGELQGIQWPLAEMWAEREAARLLTYRAAWLLDQRQRCDAEVAAAKFVASEAAVRAAKRTVDLFGGYGYMEEYPAQRFYRDAECLIASAGTSEAMRIIMARRMMA